MLLARATGTCYASDYSLCSLQARKLAHKLANARKGQGQDRAFFAAVSTSLGYSLTLAWAISPCSKALTLTPTPTLTLTLALILTLTR